MAIKRRELTEEEHNQIIVITFYKNTGEIKPPPRPGPQPKLTERDTRHLVRLVKKDRKSSLNVLTNKFC
ncbi:1117_t:CDS:2 [Rhizophagus irregularis]|nr:1117_t:CDS:2 [Rhizophagus irregularis]